MEKFLRPGDKFPRIQGRSVDNIVFNPSLFFGKKIFYSFFRFTGCPACCLYFNQIQIKKRELEAKNIILVGIFEVEYEILKEIFVTGERHYWGVFLADPTGKLYDQCCVTRSSTKLNMGVLDRRYRQTMREGKEVMLAGVDSRHMQDASGKKNRMPGQFLVDARGKVLAAHYGKNISDRMAITELL